VPEPSLPKKVRGKKTKHFANCIECASFVMFFLGFRFVKQFQAVLHTTAKKTVHGNDLKRSIRINFWLWLAR
jgi:hypothetical protein